MIFEKEEQFFEVLWHSSPLRHLHARPVALSTAGTREAAYLLAVTSAGVAHAVTKACSSGKHVHCGCDRTVYDHPSGKNHRWSGCSDNIFFLSLIHI